MRYLKPVAGADHEQTTRTCARWFSDELGLRIVEYQLGNVFTGCIDMLATDDTHVYLIIVNDARLEDALLRALMGYGWFQANLGFLSRGYPKEEIDLSLPPVLVICSPSFPHEAPAIFDNALKPPVRLFKYVMLGAPQDPDLYIEEISSGPAVSHAPAAREDLAALRQELGITRAGLTDEEIRDFRAALAGVLHP